VTKVGKIEQLTTNIQGLSKTDAKKIMSDMKQIMRSAEATDELKKIKKELAAAKKRISQLESRNAKLEGRIFDHKGDLMKANRIKRSFGELISLITEEKRELNEDW
jgi:hypothetical protein